MKQTPRRRPGKVSEPVQVYLDRPDRDRLERLAAQLDATKSDVLRRGLEALEALVRKPAARKAKPAPLPVFKGGRLQPGVNLDDTSSLLDLMDGLDSTR